MMENEKLTCLVPGKMSIKKPFPSNPMVTSVNEGNVSCVGWVNVDMIMTERV